MSHPSSCSSTETSLDEEKNKAETTVAGSFDYEFTYDVLSMIFKKLNIRDLGNAAQVCRFWSEVATNEKRFRYRSEITSLRDLKESWQDLHPGKEFVDCLRFKPMIHFVFTGDCDYETHPVQQERSDCPCQSLPSSCGNIVIGNDGIVKDRIELQDIKHKAACLLLPEEQGVTIQTVCALGPLRRGIEIWPADALIEEMALAENNVECFIVFTNGDQIVSTSHLLNNIPRDNRSISGSKVSCLRICAGGKCNRIGLWAAIMISGPSVKSWSVVVRKSCNTKEKVEARLKLLKDKVTLKKHSVAFMFASQERGSTIFEEKNVRSTIFKKLFPDIPLIGTFGYATFGHCHVEPIEKRVFYNSTVFMILTYGEL